MFVRWLGKETAHVTTPLLGESFYCKREHKEHLETSGRVQSKEKESGLDMARAIFMKSQRE